MNPTLVLLLLSPAIAAICAIGFFGLWLYQRQRRYIAILAAAYAIKILGFALLIAGTVPMLEKAAKLGSNAALVTTMVLVAIAVLQRAGRPVPYLAILGLAGASLLATAWYVFVDPNFSARAIFVNFAIGVMSAMVGVLLSRTGRRNAVETLLIWAFHFHALACFLRPGFLFLPGNPPGAALNTPLDSPFWVALMASDIIASIVALLGLFAAVGLDLIDELRSETDLDPLSGILNRRGFERQANALLSASREFRVPVAVVLCDIDHFKAVNDTYGHIRGDEVIVAFARHLTATAPDSAIIGRLGGEEFAVLLPASDCGVGRLFAETARATFVAMPDELPERMRVTASFGVTEMQDGDVLNMLLHRADQALYRAKKEGRDRVRVAKPGETDLGRITLARLRAA